MDVDTTKKSCDIKATLDKRSKMSDNGSLYGK
jgi:hypothetical protein